MHGAGRALTAERTALIQFQRAAVCLANHRGTGGTWIYSELGLGVQSWGGAASLRGRGSVGVSWDPVGCPRALCPHPRSLWGSCCRPPAPGSVSCFYFTVCPPRPRPPAGPGALTRLRGCGTGQHRASAPCPKPCGYGAAAPRPRGHGEGPGGVGTAPGPARARGGGRRFATVWLFCDSVEPLSGSVAPPSLSGSAVPLSLCGSVAPLCGSVAPLCGSALPASLSGGAAPRQRACAARFPARCRAAPGLGDSWAAAAAAGPGRSHGRGGAAQLPGTGTGHRHRAAGSPVGAAPSVRAGSGLCAVPSDGAGLRRGRRGLALRTGPLTPGLAAWHWQHSAALLPAARLCLHSSPHAIFLWAFHYDIRMMAFHVPLPEVKNTEELLLMVLSLTCFAAQFIPQPCKGKSLLNFCC